MPIALGVVPSSSHMDVDEIETAKSQKVSTPVALAR
jgi:hypothetical protein